jgi:hypothetical protein
MSGPVLAENINDAAAVIVKNIPISIVLTTRELTLLDIRGHKSWNMLFLDILDNIPQITSII